MLKIGLIKLQNSETDALASLSGTEMLVNKQLRLGWSDPDAASPERRAHLEVCSLPGHVRGSFGEWGQWAISPEGRALDGGRYGRRFADGRGRAGRARGGWRGARAGRGDVIKCWCKKFLVVGLANKHHRQWWYGSTGISRQVA